ncbi:MAG: hypothetical protein KAW88_07060, partial [Candidatus Cloacimonetes bacterium]|nr:hypothetical protein [Candidatus Cloacimonadota bacterium]
MKGSETVTYNVNIAGIAAMRGFEIEIDYSTSDFSSASLSQGTFLSGVGSTQWYITGSAGSDIANCAIIGSTNGAFGSGTLFTIDLTSANVNNLTGSALTLPSVTLRDINNQTITCDDTTGAVITIDSSSPTMESISESEGAYYNTAPTFANFGFDDNYNLNDIDYKIDTGSWTAVADNVSGTEYNDDGWTLPGFAGLSQGTHTLYWRADDDAGNMVEPLTETKFRENAGTGTMNYTQRINDNIIQTVGYMCIGYEVGKYTEVDWGAPRYVSQFRQWGSICHEGDGRWKIQHCNGDSWVDNTIDIPVRNLESWSSWTNLTIPVITTKIRFVITILDYAGDANELAELEMRGWGWQFYKDTEAPAGTMSISFSSVTTTAMNVTGAALVDASQGDEYYEFDCTTSPTWDRARTINDNINECTGMTANTGYTFKYQGS